VKEFKSVILSYTDNKPFSLRFNIDNDNYIEQLIKLSYEFHINLKEKDFYVIEVWKDTRFFDLSMEGVEIKDGNEKLLPTINIPGRTWNWTLFSDKEDAKAKMK